MVDQTSGWQKRCSLAYLQGFWGILGQGHIYVVWADERTEAESDSQREKSSGHRIYFNRSDDHGGTWLPEDIKLSGDAAGSGRMMQAWPQIRSDDHGHTWRSIACSGSKDAPTCST